MLIPGVTRSRGAFLVLVCCVCANTTKGHPELHLEPSLVKPLLSLSAAENPLAAVVAQWEKNATTFLL